MQPGEQHGRVLLRLQNPCSPNGVLPFSAGEDEDATATFGCAIMSNGVMPGIVYLGALLASAFGIGMNVCALWSFIYTHKCVCIFIIIFFLPAFCAWETENGFVIGKEKIMDYGNE